MKRFALFIGDNDEDQSRDANSWDYRLTREEMIARVTLALRSTDEGGLVIRVDVHEPAKGGTT